MWPWKKGSPIGNGKIQSHRQNGNHKKSAGSVATYIVFAQIILIVALLPIFSFQKVEGKMFSPLAFTLGYALLGSLILSITYVPALCKVLLTKTLLKRKYYFSLFPQQPLQTLFME